MSNKFISVVGIVIAAVALLAVGAFGFSLSSSEDAASDIVSQQNVGIWVTGTGEVSVVPDIAVINMGVNVQMDTLTAAQQQAATSMAAIMAVLESYNIAEEDIQTSSYYISPIWNYDESNNEYLAGYQVYNTIEVQVRNTDNAGSIIDDVVVAGGDYVIINNISFTVEDSSSYYTEARAAAMADAIAKATQLAELSGVTLGDPTYIYDGSSYSSKIYYDVAYDTISAEGTSASTSISTGEVDVTVTIQVVFAIE